VQDSKILVLLVCRIDFHGTYSVSWDYLYSLWRPCPFGTGDGARLRRGRSWDCYYADRSGRNGLCLSLLKEVRRAMEYYFFFSFSFSFFLLYFFLSFAYFYLLLNNILVWYDSFSLFLFFVLLSFLFSFLMVVYEVQDGRKRSEPQILIPSRPKPPRAGNSPRRCVK